MNKPGTKPDPNKVYKRDKKGQFAKVNSLLKKIAMAKAQGVPHVPPGPTKKVPPPFSALKNPAAKKLGYDLYMRKKAGEFSNDHSIYLAAAKLSSHYKKTHPSASAGMSANQIVNAYKRHEYDEVGYVTLLGQISGNLNQLDRTGPGSDWTPSGKPSAPSKPTIDKTKSGLSITSDKFPKPDTLKPTGQTLGGVTGVKVYVDSKGVEWAVKTPKTGSNAYGNKSFMVDIEIAASRLQNKAGLPVPAMHEEEVDGKHSAVSKMYKAPDGGKVAEAFPKGKGLDISVMTEQDIADMQRNQIFDWLIGNHDTHSANFLRTENGIVGIDKGQAFKFFGKDKLDYNYQPVTPLDGNVSVYQSMWKQFAKGYGELLDPNGPELKGTIERIQNIPDEDYKKLLRPYATKAVASGSISMPNKPVGAGKAELVNHFLDEAVKRKNNLAKDFGDYYAKVKAEHDSNKPNPAAQLGAVAAHGRDIGAKLYPSKLQVGLEFAIKTPEGKYGSKSTVTHINGDNVTIQGANGDTIDVEKSFFASGNFYITGLPSGNAPELNKPLKTVDGLKVGDKIEAPWGSVFTVTGFGSDGNGKYVETANAKGGFGGNIYNSTIAAAGPDNPFAFVGNVNDQGAVDLKDLAGQLVNDIGDVIPGDKLTVNINNHDVKVTVTSIENAPAAIYVKKASTGAIVVIKQGHFKEGKVKYAYARGGAAAASAISSATQWPEYPEKDLVTGPFTNQNAPGTTLKSLNLPGWGGFTGDLNVGDEIVGYGANGEFKKGSVVQSAGGPMNVYVSWDDDPSGDWVEFTHTGQGGFWGDGDINGVDSFTLVGKKAGATSGPAPQMPIGPHAATQASSIPTVSSPNKGKVATFDDLEVGVVYHAPGGKMQKVIFKDADSFQAQSVSGNKHTYPKEKFNNWAAQKGVLIGMPGDEDPAPSLSEVSKDNVYMLPKDPFDPYGTETKYVVKSKTAKAVVLKDVSTGGEKTVDVKDWDTEAKSWKHVPGMSDWEKYSQGIITWEEYQETNGHKETAKLHSPEGPAAPGKPSPAADFASKKAQKITEKKPPPPWSAIKGAHVKEMGAEVYELKKSGSLTTDHELYLACGKVIRAWEKKYPNETNWPSNNQLRHAARRLEYEENGVVVWETEDQKTAKLVPDIQTKKSVMQHKPSGKYTIMHDPDKLPLTAFGDSKKLAGSYQNPVNFGVTYSLTDNMIAWGNDSNPQVGYPSGEEKSIEFYTGSGASNAINPYLRTGSVNYGSSSSVASHVKNIDAAMAKSNPVKDWTICTRGTYGGYDIGIDHDNLTIDQVRGQIGKTVLQKGYTSSSLGSKPAFGGDLRIIYRVPPGLKGLWVSGDGKGHKISSCGSSEREFILPRSLKLKVIAAEEHKDGFGYKYDVVVEIVGWEGQ